MKKIELIICVFFTIFNVGISQTNVINADLLPITINKTTEWGPPVFIDTFDTTSNWISVRNVETDHEVYFNMHQDVTSDNGYLKITSGENNQYVQAHNRWYYLSSGDAWTKTSLPAPFDSGKLRYGYFEIEAKLAKGKGMHSSFWLYGGGHEIDVFEASLSADYSENNTYYTANSATGNEPITHFGTNLHDQTDPNNDIDYSYDFGTPRSLNYSLDRSFNTYAVEWTPYDITWYFNDREIRSVTGDEYYNKFGFYPDDINPMRIILSVGNDLKFDEQAITGEMLVNYIKVWQKDTADYISKPIINGCSEVCSASSTNVLYYSASNYSSGDNFKWEVIDDGGYIASGSTTASNVGVKLSPGKRTMTLKLF